MTLMLPISRILLALAIILVTTGHAVAIDNLPTHSAVPGGVAVIKLDDYTGKEKVTFDNQPVLIVQREQGYYAIIGIPLNSKAGTYQLHIADDKQVAITVSDKAYRTQHLTIKDKRKVSPNEEDMKRIRSETKKIGAAFRQWTPSEDSDLNFLVPSEGIISDSFGSRRFFNGLARNPHSGMDIAAPVGTHIVSAAAGKVVLTGDFFFNGNSVFIDHGQGLITMYCHLDSISVSEGHKVAKGELIGTVGKTGRVTGAHLHWTVSLNDARVDPGLFIKHTTQDSTPKQQQE